MAKNPQIEALNNLGQVVWYDNLSRDVLHSGELKSLIDAGVSGLTSNPTIFKKAIADTKDYDADIKRLTAESPSITSEQLCEELMVADVAAAADLLLPIYKASKGYDGYASIEVSPYLAREAAPTVEAAKRIWSKLDRPNIMIKIPGTPECLPAIKTVLEAGINVNITLLFSVEMYEKVVEQYLSALEARTMASKEIGHIASVASFFVSRVDAICEQKFDELLSAGKVKEEQRNIFFGRLGVANARVTYKRFEDLFGGDRFTKLKAKGAKIQKPLWASTGTKNPKLNPLLYVEELAGRETVNTMPPATLAVLLKGGNIEPRLTQGVTNAQALLSEINKLSMNFNQMMLELQDKGVDLFADSYRDLIASIENKRKLVTGT